MTRDTMRIVIAVAGCTSAACGAWQRVGSEPTPDASAVLPRLFDPAATHRELGLLAPDDAPRFVASVAFVAGPTPDSTIAVVAVSLAASALTFRSRGDHFEAQFAAELRIRRDGAAVAERTDDGTVRVGTFAETQQAEASIVFQHAVRVPPDTVVIGVSVEDVEGQTRSGTEAVFSVPRFGAGVSLSSLVPVSTGVRRTALDAPLRIVVNPRASVPYGSDSLQFYVEAYGLTTPATMLVRAIAQSDGQMYRDTIELDARSPVSAVLFAVPTSALAVGEFLLEIDVPAVGVAGSSGALVTFSHEWAVANFTEVLSLLRYFGQDRAVRQMREAPVAQRARLWGDFWSKTDPNPVTPEHEAIQEYFRRLSEANALFAEPGRPGWLTDRGEVAVTLGAPDEVFDFSSDLQTRSGLRTIRWNYISERLTLDFVDETGFGNFRLTGASRADYLRVLNRVRRSE